MSNLYKAYTIVNKDERVIDYNDVIKDKLRDLLASKTGRIDPDGFVNGLNVDVVETLLDEDGNPVNSESFVNEGEINDSKAGMDFQDMAAVKAHADEILERANIDAQKIIDEANAAANDVLNNVNQQAEDIREEAKRQGYNDGINAAEAEIENIKNTLQAESEQIKLNLKEEYDRYKAEVEPELVEVLTEVFRKVTLTVAEDNKDIIMHLINGVMRKAENSHEFVIRVSSDDYKFLVNNQGKIYCAISKEVSIDIVEDNTMQANECIIETDNGIFNCSLDIELDNLIKDLKLLNCV